MLPNALSSIFIVCNDLFKNMMRIRKQKGIVFRKRRGRIINIENRKIKSKLKKRIEKENKNLK